VFCWNHVCLTNVTQSKFLTTHMLHFLTGWFVRSFVCLLHHEYKNLHYVNSCFPQPLIQKYNAPSHPLLNGGKHAHQLVFINITHPVEPECTHSTFYLGRYICVYTWQHFAPPYPALHMLTLILLGGKKKSIPADTHTERCK